jgi:hypothetical protein
MNKLLEMAIGAHGGLDRWQSKRTIAVDLSVGGALWDLKRQRGLFADGRYEAELQTQHATLGRFGGPDQHVRFTPDRLVLEKDDGELLQVRDHPLTAFAGHVLETPWDLLHAAYFDGYALWTYFTQPFLYSYPDFVVEEIEPWQENGELWRRLKVTFPEGMTYHNREQVTYFGPDGLICRHDYAVDILGGSYGAHYIHDYREFDGIMVPTRRRVFPLGPDNKKLPEPVLITIDITEVRFA